MGDLIGGLVRLVLRILFFAAGLVFAACLLVAVLFIAAFWALRFAWARLTGRPVAPWGLGAMDPRAGFRRFNEAVRPAEPEPTGAERAAERARGSDKGDVQDVPSRDLGPRG